MRLKRKASALELDSLRLPTQAQWHQQTSLHPFFQAQHPSSPPSLISSAPSPGSSPSSMNTEPFQNTLQPNHEPSSSYFAAPWLHSRTRKRVRDNRPSESQIHYDTVRRLFDAQRSTQHPADDTMMMMEDDHAPATGFAEPHIMSYDSSDMTHNASQQMEEDYHDACLDAPEANQRSIHDFFARRKGKERENGPVALSMPIAVAMSMPMSATLASPFNLAAELQQQQPPLKEKRSFGVLSGMNHMNTSELEREAAVYSDVAALSGAMAGAAASAIVSGSRLPCDFRTAEAVVAMMEDAMVIG